MRPLCSFKTVPVAEELLGTETPPPVSIPSDEVPDASEEADSTSEPEATQTATPTPTLTPTPTQDPEPTKAISLTEYQELYQEMLAVAEKPKRALVTVIGITSQMDYFNQNYENPAADFRADRCK